MSRTFTWGSSDWYSTVSFIFAGDSEQALPESKMLEIFDYYYNKFYASDPIRIERRKVIETVLSPSLAMQMFGNKGQSSIAFQNMMPKQQFFREMMRSFREEEQYEILRRLFDEGFYFHDGYDSKYLQSHINSSESERYLVYRYDELLKVRALNTIEKRDILHNLLRGLEPYRDCIKKTAGSGYDVIFSMGNNLNIRHNNLEGIKRNETVSKMTKKELTSLYDKLFVLIKVVMNILQDKHFYKHYEECGEIITEFKALNSSFKGKCGKKKSES